MELRDAIAHLISAAKSAANGDLEAQKASLATVEAELRADEGKFAGFVTKDDLAAAGYVTKDELGAAIETAVTPPVAAAGDQPAQSES